MKILGFDTSSKSTGWGFKNNNKIEFNKINPTGITSLHRKLNLFYIESKKIIEKYKPDKIVIEEVIYCKNVNAIRLLSKIHGVISLAAFQYLSDDPILYEPKKWKKLIGNGNYKKCEIQLLICKEFKLLSNEIIKQYEDKIQEIYDSTIKVKEKNKLFENLSIDIYGNSGLNNDEADSLAMCLALEKELKDEK
jgi:Holliday junction resolvasome RuvABC endonuclease subunit